MTGVSCPLHSGQTKSDPSGTSISLRESARLQTSNRVHLPFRKAMDLGFPSENFERASSALDELLIDLIPEIVATRTLDQLKLALDLLL